MTLSAAMRTGRLLDVGCGEGFVLPHFASLGWDLQGVDFSVAGMTLMNLALVDRVVQGDIFTILETRIADDETWNLVWMGNVLEHALDPIGML